MNLAVAALWTIVAAAAPQPAPTAPAHACKPDIVHPEESARTQAFLAWLKPRANDLLDEFSYLFEDTSSPGLEVFVADVDNDGRDDYVLTVHEGSGNFLTVWVLRHDGNAWALATDVPFKDRLEGSHDYRGPRMRESALLVRFGGKTNVSFQGGDTPTYFPETYVWEHGVAHLACDTPWLRYQQSVFHKLLDDGFFIAAHVLLDGVQDLCRTTADRETWRSIQNDGRKNLPAQPRSAYDFAWLKDLVKRTPDAQLVLDRRFDSLLLAIAPDARLEDGQPLRAALKVSIWLPDTAQLIDDRYVVLSGCEPHNCRNKGFIWIDTAERRAFVMTAGTLASTSIDARAIPPQFWRHVELTPER